MIATKPNINDQLLKRLARHRQIPCKIISGQPDQPSNVMGVAFSYDTATGLIGVTVAGQPYPEYYSEQHIRLINADIEYREELSRLPDGVKKAGLADFPKRNSMGTAYYVRWHERGPFFRYTINPFSKSLSRLIKSGKVWIDEPPKRIKLCSK